MQLLLISHQNVLPVSLISSRSSTYVHLHCCSLNSSSFRHVVLLTQITIFSDHLTPVLAYRCLVKEEHCEAPSFLDESIEPGFEGSRTQCDYIGPPCWKIAHKTVEDPMTIPASISNGWKLGLIDDELPDTFCGGWFGFFSYDTVRYVENKKLPFSRAPEDDRNLADIQLGLYDDVIVFDHVEKVRVGFSPFIINFLFLQKAHVIHWVRLDQYSSLPEAYLNGKKHLEILMSTWNQVVTIEKHYLQIEFLFFSPSLSPGSVDFCIHEFGTSLTTENMTREEYKNAVLQAKEHIDSGDIFQIAKGCTLVASSPETLTRVKKKRIVNRPLAGTSRKGKTPDEDAMLEMQMLKDEKQCAEHIMLVDLGRNDVDKRYSHVMQMSSVVSGELLDHLTCWDALQAALPVGTICGAPKVKAMELIDQLEVGRRGPYSGGFGGISFSGDMDIGLALRTMVLMNGPRYDTMYSYTDAGKRQEWVAHLQSEARIVNDSDPDEKQIECENKVACLCRAIDLAESAFVKGRSSVLKINDSVPNV
ncbi:hypothetical protein R3W88_000749 [Solanum pinnatisectum]|uniref:Uncharacterized protein n=1 Tax=Solanum pinnatisectum TaxID=50273 RepID=A0AAV9MJZ9_9SOLN|nr:hypothetical protein R3W88_000749 [Solanum pinnatisectum]